MADFSHNRVKKRIRRQKERLGKGLRAAQPLPINLPEKLPNDVVILPLSIEQGSGLYPGRLVHTAKQLRAVGVDAAYLDDPDHRRWNVLLGDLPTVIAIGIGTSVVGSAAWAALVAGFRKVFPTKGKVSARVVRQRLDVVEGTVKNTWFEYDGEMEGFLKALPKIDGND